MNRGINYCIVIIAALLVAPLYAQESSKKTQTSEFNVAPYFNYNKTAGAGFGLVPLYSFYMNKKDAISPKSTVGLVGYYTTKKSSAVLTFGNFFFNEDTWRIVYALGINTYNFQTYFDSGVGDGAFVDYTTKSDFVVLNVRRKIYKELYFGLGYNYQKSDTDFGGLAPNIDTELNTLRFELFRDARDNVNYPKNGSLAVVRFHHIPKWMGNDETSNVLIVNYNNYIATHDNRDIIALRFHTKLGLQNISFQQQTVLGGVDLRGYSEGKYRGDGMMDMQGEYRWNFENKLRLSAVGFAGLGTLYGSDTENFNWKLYPSIGAGIRWTALTSNHVNIGLDAGFGKDDWGIYFRINEAF